MNQEFGTGKKKIQYNDLLYWKTKKMVKYDYWQNKTQKELYSEKQRLFSR